MIYFTLFNYRAIQAYILRLCMLVRLEEKTGIAETKAKTRRAKTKT